MKHKAIASNNKCPTTEYLNSKFIISNIFLENIEKEMLIKSDSNLDSKNYFKIINTKVRKNFKRRKHIFIVK